MIGLFDSGIGGLTVLREVAKRLPKVKLLYFGDTARTPYGNKSPEVVSEYGVEAARFLVRAGAKVLVVACNSVSAVGLEALRAEFPKVPLFDVITPAVTAVRALPKVARVGVMGTRALVGSNVYQRLLSAQKDIRVFAHAAPLLVPLAEEGWVDKPESKRIVKRYLTPFKQAQVDTLVLACTHYPLFKEVIQARIPKRTRLIDPAEATAQALYDWLQEYPSEAKKLSEGESEFCLTDAAPHTVEIAQKWLRRTVQVEKVTL